MAKSPAQWTTDDGTSVVTAANANVQRLQEDSTVRTLEDGTTRILEDTVVTPKAPTVWTDL